MIRPMTSTLSALSKSRAASGRLNMEIDPTKLDDAADPKVNTLELWLIAQKIFSCIVRSVNFMPAELV